MVLWAVLVTVACLILLLLLLALRREIKKLCLQLVFLKGHATNMRLQGGVPLCGLNGLVDEINALLDRTGEVERSAKTSQEELKEAITNLSHDIRTPLTSLDGYFQLLEESECLEERQRYSAVIRTRITMLKELLEELFTFTKLQNDSWQLALEPVDLHKCLLDVIFSFYNEWTAKGLQPDLQIEDAPCWVLGNQEALGRVLQNVLKNTLLHGDGEIQLSLKSAGDTVCFSCANRVAHPEKIDVAQLFSRFYKQDSARTKTSTGLGLSIARGLSERMEGQLTANLTGARFEIRLCLPILSLER